MSNREFFKTPSEPLSIDHKAIQRARGRVIGLQKKKDTGDIDPVALAEARYQYHYLMLDRASAIMHEAFELCAQAKADLDRAKAEAAEKSVASKRVRGAA